MTRFVSKSGDLEIVPQPDRELLVLALECLSKALDDMPASMPLVTELVHILQRLHNPIMRLQEEHDALERLADAGLLARRHVDPGKA